MIIILILYVLFEKLYDFWVNCLLYDVGRSFLVESLVILDIFNELFCVTSEYV